MIKEKKKKKKNVSMIYTFVVGVLLSRCSDSGV